MNILLTIKTNKTMQTLQDIETTPLSEKINLIEVFKGRSLCPFCGERLLGRRNGIGRDQWYETIPCRCRDARFAQVHNELHEAYQKASDPRKLEIERLHNVVLNKIALYQELHDLPLTKELLGF